MEKERFTKEEIETARKIYEKWDGYEYVNFRLYLDSLLKPKYKTMFFKVEYEEHTNGETILGVINSFGKVNGFKATELTREDMTTNLRIDKFNQNE